MLRIICRNENSRNSEMIFRNEASSEEIYEWIKSNYRNIIEIQIEFHEKEEYCKTFVDTKGSIKATTNTEDSEATEARNSEKLSVQPEPKKTATMKVFEESDLDGIQIPEEIEYSIFNQTVVVEASVEAIHKLELLINEKKTKTQQKRKEQSNEAKKAQHKTVPKSLEPKKTVESNDKKSKN